MNPLRPRLLLACLPLLVGACAIQRPPAHIEIATPLNWQAPLPHQGQLSELKRWWEQLQDPILVTLIDDAQTVSPSVAQARSQLAQARVANTAARAGLLPAVNAQASTSRGFNEQVGALASTVQLGVQAGWELDVFGTHSAGLDAANERLQSATAQWHEARVTVAAEVALQYSGWHHCTRQLQILQSDASSRAATARLTQESEQAGFTAPATAALAAASASDASVRARQQQMHCEIEIKTLVALSGMDEPTLRARLARAPAWEPPAQLFHIDALPANTLAQRPDLYAAEREVAAASAEVGQALAQRYPRLSLTGSIGRGWLSTGGSRVTSNTWAIGPVAVHLPIFDAGLRRAQIEAAQIRYETAAQIYRAQVRKAISEVEQALVQLGSVVDREGDAQRSTEGYRRSFEATQARWEAGMASLVELEDARRTALSSETALIALEQERMTAWIALYRAAGGGWNRSEQALPVSRLAAQPSAP